MAASTSPWELQAPAPFRTRQPPPPTPTRPYHGGGGGAGNARRLTIYTPPQKKHNCLEASEVPSFGGAQLFSRFGSSGAQALDSRIWHLEFPDFGGPNCYGISAAIGQSFGIRPKANMWRVEELMIGASGGFRISAANRPEFRNSPEGK